MDCCDFGQLLILFLFQNFKPWSRILWSHVDDAERDQDEDEQNDHHRDDVRSPVPGFRVRSHQFLENRVDIKTNLLENKCFKACNFYGTITIFRCDSISRLHSGYKEPSKNGFSVPISCYETYLQFHSHFHLWIS